MFNLFVMTNVKTFAGFDISKAFFDVCVRLQDKQYTKQFRYDAAGIAALIQWLPKDSHCIMEATGPYYLKLAYALHQHGFCVSVVNPLVIKRFSQMRLVRAKTDKADAQLIAAYGLTQQPPRWQPPAAYLIKLQQLQALEQQLQKQHSALLGQREAFEASGFMDQELQAFMDTALAHLAKQLHDIVQRMEAIIATHHHNLLHHITTIPGIGKKTAMMLIVVSAGFSKFSHYKQLSAYLGLSPRIYQSGSSVKGKARICKMGVSRIRALLYVCAWSAKRCNQACKALYERLIAKGKAKRLALIAVANKLIKQAFAIATKNTAYQANYAKNICS